MTEQSLEELLADAGAVLKRQNKHAVYSLQNGKTFVASCTPSDRRAEKNMISTLRRIADLPRPEKPEKTARKKKKPKAARSRAAVIDHSPVPHGAGVAERVSGALVELAEAALDRNSETAFEDYMRLTCPDLKRIN